ncbi:glycoside hydrolase family 28 protein [Bacteroidales bacterium OttesenSCG-928-J19]|nr:glycoside hydrolase family 28 protein [Bacteroidales bacterium OttesenSCG-928-J19]
MKEGKKIGWVITCFLFVFSILSCEKTEKVPVESFKWIDKEEQIDLSWTAEVGAKTFPDRREFRVNDYGAAADTNKLSTEAIQNAIDACAQSGGGRVTFSPGHYKTGALFVKNGVDLHLDREVVLYGSQAITDYPEFQTRVAGIEMVWPGALINIIDSDNAAVSGEGLIDCQGNVFWDLYWTMRKDYEKRGLRWIVDYDAKRVRGILVSNSKNVTLKDFSIMRSGFWCIQVLYSQYCTLNNLTINNNIGGHGPSTDGIDIDSSSFILVENCDVDCNDDNICLKAGRDADGLRVNRPTENIVIRHCTARKGAGLITCGSETSGGIRNVMGYDLKAQGTSTVLRLKSSLNRGGFIENIYLTDVEADSIARVIEAGLNWNPSYSYSKLPEEYVGQPIPSHWETMLMPVEPEERGYPSFRNIYLSNINARNVGQFISAAGWNEELKLINFNLYNIYAECEKAGKIIYTDGFSMRNTQLKIKDKEKILLRDNTSLVAELNYHE